MYNICFCVHSYADEITRHSHSIRQKEGTGKKKRQRRIWTIQHLVINCLMFVYFAWICTSMCDALSKGYSMCTRAKGNHPILASIRTRLFLSLPLFFSSLRSIVTFSFVASRTQTHALFSSLLHTHTYIDQMRTNSFFWAEQKNLSLPGFFLSSLSLFLICIRTREKKTGSECEKRTRLSILRN